MPQHNPPAIPRLSDKEKVERIAAGQCFMCGETGHFSQDCPSKRTMKAVGSKLPGAVAFNVEPIGESSADDSVEILDSLLVGAMASNYLEIDQIHPSNKWMELSAPALFGPLDEWRNHYPRWKEPGVWAQWRIGDCYALVVDAILTLAHLIPSNKQRDMGELRPKLCFRVVKSPTALEYSI